jgi:hypothetical protein
MADETTVHILFAGGALCMKPGVPGDWGDDDRWVGYGDHDSATCRDCLIEARIADAVSTGLREHQEHALLQLLRRAVAWRTQGHISAWKTPPSRALALEVDKLFETLPALVAAVAPEAWAKHQAAFGGAAKPPALACGPLTIAEHEPPTFTLSQWSLAVGSRWGRVLHFADWLARAAGVELERAELTDAAATLHLRLGTRDVSHTVAWAVVEAAIIDDDWRRGIATAVHDLQRADRAPTADPYR